MRAEYGVEWLEVQQAHGDDAHDVVGTAQVLAFFRQEYGHYRARGGDYDSGALENEMGWGWGECLYGACACCCLFIIAYMLNQFALAKTKKRVEHGQPITIIAKHISLNAHPTHLHDPVHMKPFRADESLGEGGREDANRHQQGPGRQHEDGVGKDERRLV